jgi:hypothetical protein
MAVPKPKALSTIAERATKAAEERDATANAMRLQMIADHKQLAIDLAKTKLETATKPDDWETVNDIPSMRMAVQLEVTPLATVLLPKLGSDFLLKVGSDPARWPTVRDLAHLGTLMAERGLG